MGRLGQVAYDHIFRLMADGRLPPGSRLSNRGLAKDIGVSLIPVREAIRQLVSEGLVDHQPGLGAFVKQANVQELRDLFELREALECHAVRYVVRDLSPAQLAEMEGHNQQMIDIATSVAQSGGLPRSPEQVNQWLMADAALHMVILRANGNARVLKIIGELRMITHIFGQRSNVSLEVLQSTCADHARLVELLQQRDVEAAVSAMSDHIRHGWSVVLAGYAEEKYSSEGAAARELLQELHRMEIGAKPQRELTP